MESQEGENSLHQGINSFCIPVSFWRASIEHGGKSLNLELTYVSSNPVSAITGWLMLDKAIEVIEAYHWDEDSIYFIRFWHCWDYYMR